MQTLGAERGLLEKIIEEIHPIKSAQKPEEGIKRAATPGFDGGDGAAGDPGLLREIRLADILLETVVLQALANDGLM